MIAPPPSYPAVPLVCATAKRLVQRPVGFAVCGRRVTVTASALRVASAQRARVRSS